MLLLLEDRLDILIEVAGLQTRLVRQSSFLVLVEHLGVAHEGVYVLFAVVAGLRVRAPFFERGGRRVPDVRGLVSVVGILLELGLDLVGGVEVVRGDQVLGLRLVLLGAAVLVWGKLLSRAALRLLLVILLMLLVTWLIMLLMRFTLLLILLMLSLRNVVALGQLLRSAQL